MRREELYLRDIVESAGFVAQFLDAVDRDEFERSELIRSAVAQKLLLIGEAAAHVSGEIRARHAGIPWAKIVGFRNILIHSYFGVDWDAVWLVAAEEAPERRARIEKILEAEFYWRQAVCRCQVPASLRHRTRTR